MGRAKIPMEPITDNKKRKTTFNSRSNGIIKKARELAILCQVNVSIIIFTDYQQTPKIFPPDHDKINSLIDVYNRTNPESINRYTLLDYYKDMKIKTEEQVVRAKKKNLEAKFPSWFDFLDNLSEAGLREFALGLENKIVDVQSRIEGLKNNVEFPVQLMGLYNNNQMMMQSWNPNLIDPVMKLNEDDDHNVIMMPSLYPEYHLMMNEYDDHVVNDGENFSPLMEQYPEYDSMMNEYDHHVVNEGDNFSLEHPQLMEQYYCFPPDHQSLQQQLLMSYGTFQ